MASCTSRLILQRQNLHVSSAPDVSAPQPEPDGTSGTIMESRADRAKSAWVFTGEEGTGPLSVYTPGDQQSRVRKALGLRECVIDSFRHTFGTRLGKSV